MVVAYFDCFSGIAGDMVLGALIDLGFDSDYLNSEIKKLGLTGYSIDVKKVKKNNIFATDVLITVNEKEQPSRSYKEIVELIDSSFLDQKVKDLSKKIFYKLAIAEAKVHGVDFQDVHFHEIGAVDSIIDIVGISIGLESLGIDQIYSSSLPLGSGFVNCSHGKIPIPAPATVLLLDGVPTYQSDAKHEMVTPTGAAVITTITQSFGKRPNMNVKKIGYGSGKIKSNQPGLLRVFLGKKQ